MIGALLALGLFVLPAFSQSPGAGEKTLELNEWSKCGFVSRFSPNKINPECFQNLNNAILDQDLSILRRNGYAPYNPTACTGSQPVRGLWRFDATDGSQYLIVQSSASMFYSKGDGSCTAITGLNGGLSTTAQMSCVQGIGYLWCSNGTNAVFKTNATSTAAISGAPLGKYIGFFRNRIVISGVSANVTSIYLSGELNGEDWTLPGVTYSTSPAIIKINGVNDGLGVKCLMGEFQNGYYLGRDYDTWTLAGYDNRDFTLRQVDSHIGCMDNNSPRLVNNQLIWLSHRGVEGLTGTQIQWLSYPISPTIETIINAAGNSQAQTITTQADWQLGNLTASGPGAPISATIAPGSIVPSSATFTDASTAEFIQGTLTNVSTNTFGLALAVTSNTIAGGTFSTITPWTVNSGSNHFAGVAANGATITTGSGCGNFTVTCPTGDATCGYTGETNGCICPGFGMAATVFDGKTGSSIYDANFVAANAEVLNYEIPISGIATSSSVTVCFQWGAAATCNDVQPSIKGNVTTPIGFNLIVNGKSGCSSGYRVNAVGNVRISSYSPTGAYTSRAFDTTFSTPVMSNAVVSYSSSAVGAITLQQQNSSDGASWSSASTLVSGNQALGTKRYWRYIENYSTSNGTTTATSAGISGSLVASTTGYYIAPCFTTAGNTSWGTIDINAVTNGGALSFQASTGTTCGAVIAMSANWTSQTANSIITVPTSTVLGIRALFSIDSATQAPLINDLTVNWNAGASRPNVAAEQYKNRYYLFYTTAQVVGAANDHAVVFDQNGHWQLYDDVGAASSAIYLNSLYIGDSSSTGKVYLFDSGNDDNGHSYTFSFTTPDMDGGDPIAPKQFSRAYLTLQSPSAITNNSTLDCSYTLNGSSAAYSLGTVSLSESPQTGYFVAKLPFPAGQPNTGQWVNLTCSNTGTAGPLRVYSIRLVYTPIAWP